ncbi:MAG: hypothetical protein ACREA3_00225 [Nitrosotalea sp.]
MTQDNQEETGKNPKWWSDFHTTSVLSMIVAAFDIGTFLYVNDFGTKIVLIGIFTFFGMLIVSAHHEHVKKKESRHKKKSVKSSATKSPAEKTPLTPADTDGSTSDNTDNNGSWKNWDGEIMRTSIAGTLILIYVIVVGFTVFPSPSEMVMPCDYTNSTQTSHNGTSHTIQCKEHTLRETVLDNFGSVIIVVVGFYFGSKGAIQIYKLYKGGRDTTDTQNENTSSGKKQNTG